VAFALLLQALSSLLIVPEIRLGDFGVELFYLLAVAFEVKDSPAMSYSVP
jgi:hypothetical protein